MALPFPEKTPSNDHTSDRHYGGNGRVYECLMPPSNHYAEDFPSHFQVLSQGSESPFTSQRVLDTRSGRTLLVWSLPAAWREHWPRLCVTRAVWNTLGHRSAVDAAGLWKSSAGEGYIQSEWIEGPALREIAPLPIEQVRFIIQSLAELLHRLHLRGWAYGMLQPETIRLRGDGVPVLTEWWVCRPQGVYPILPPRESAFTPGGKWLRADVATDVQSLARLGRSLITGQWNLGDSALGWDLLHPLQGGKRDDYWGELDFLSLIATMAGVDASETILDLAPLLNHFSPSSPVQEISGFAHPVPPIPENVVTEALRLLSDEELPNPAVWVEYADQSDRWALLEHISEVATEKKIAQTIVRAAEPDIPFSSWKRLLDSVLDHVDPKIAAAPQASWAEEWQAFMRVEAYDPIACQRIRAKLFQKSWNLLKTASRHQRHLIIIDEWQILDEASQAFLLRAMREQHEDGEIKIHWLITGQCPPPSPKFFKVIPLKSLEAETYEQWLRSKLHRAPLAGRFLIQLREYTRGSIVWSEWALEHLKSTGVIVRHQDSWRVPETLWPGALPREPRDLFNAAVSRLSAPAQQLHRHFFKLPRHRLLLSEGPGEIPWENPQELLATDEWIRAGLARFGVSSIELNWPAGESGCTWNGALEEQTQNRAVWIPSNEAWRHAGPEYLRLRWLQSHLLPSPIRCEALGELTGRLIAADCSQAVARLLGLGGDDCLAPYNEQWSFFHTWLTEKGLMETRPLAIEEGLNSRDHDLEAAIHWLWLRKQPRESSASPSDDLWHNLREFAQKVQESSPKVALLCALDVAHQDLTTQRFEAGLNLMDNFGPSFDAIPTALRQRAEALRIVLTARAEGAFDSTMWNKLKVMTSQQAADGDEDGHIWTLGWLAEAEAGLGLWNRLASTASLLRSQGIRLDHPEFIWKGQLSLYRALYEQGHYDAATEALGHLKGLANQRGHSHEIRLTWALEASLFTDLGRFKEAETLLYALHSEAETRADTPLGCISIINALLALGSADIAEPIARECIAQHPENSYAEARLAFLTLWAEIKFAQGDIYGTEKALQEIRKSGGAEHHPPWHLRILLLQAAWVLASQPAPPENADARRAKELAASLEASARAAQAEVLLGETALARGLPAAKAHFHCAHELADAIGHSMLKARALDGIGRSDALAEDAPTYFYDAQSLLQRLMGQASGDTQANLKKLPWVKNLLSRIFSGDGKVILDPRTHQATFDRFSVLKGELSDLTRHYGLMVRAWTAQHTQLSKLNELIRTMNESLSLDEVARNVLRITLDVTAAERAFILLKSPGRYADLIVRAGFNKIGEDVRTHPLSMTVCNRVLLRGEPWAILDGTATTTIETSHSIAALNLKTVMAAPLQLKGMPFGVLYVDSQAALLRYGTHDLEQLTTLAEHASCAIDNATLYEALVARTAQLELKLEEVRASEKLANLDPLTGIRNRRAFLSNAARQIILAKRHRKPLSLVLLDIDFFKSINDTHGHKTGDHVLLSVAQCMVKVCRDSDLVARIGGEEFVVLCPETTPEDAFALAQRLSAAVYEMNVPSLNGGKLPPIGLSGGVAGWLPHDRTIEQVLERADEALYHSKRNGRQQITLGASPSMLD